MELKCDILIYSDTEAEHIRLIQKVLKMLKKANLCMADQRRYPTACETTSLLSYQFGDH